MHHVDLEREADWPSRARQKSYIDDDDDDDRRSLCTVERSKYSSSTKTVPRAFNDMRSDKREIVMATFPLTEPSRWSMTSVAVTLTAAV